MRTLGVAVALIALLVAPAAAQRAREDPVHAEQRRLQDTQKQLRLERERAAQAKARESSLLAELEQVSRRLADKQKEVTRLDARIRAVRGDITSLHGEIGKLEVSRASQQTALARHLVTLYKVRAQGGALPMLVGGDDGVARAVTVRRLASLASLDARLIQEYRLVSGRLEDRKGRQETRQAELASLSAEAKQEQADVDRDAARRRVLLAKVRDERSYHERMVGELTEASHRLEAFIRELQARQRQIAKAPPPKPGAASVPPPTNVGFGALRGRLPWPTEGRIVTAFGAQVHPRFGTRIFRSGVDIEAAEGTDVGAVAAGHVIYTGWFKGYGNLIIVDHGNEYYTLYAHVAEVYVKEGDDVRAGQRIGAVGDTGSLEGPRLYFEVRYQGKPQDPEQWLRQRG